MVIPNNRDDRRMNILLFTGRFSTLSMPFLLEFKKRLPNDRLVISLGQLLNKSNNFSLLKVLKNNRLSYLIKRIIQLIYMSVRVKVITVFSFMKVKFINEYIEHEQIPYYEINDINSLESLKIIKENKIDLLIVCDCGQILKRRTIAAPALASINVHTSLLPKYRGTSPIFWAIKNGERETGVTIHFVDEGIDTGDIILQSKIDISPGMTEEMLTQRLSCLASEMLFEIIDGFKRNTIRPIKQDNSKATYFNNLRQVY